MLYAWFVSLSLKNIPGTNSSKKRFQRELSGLSNVCNQCTFHMNKVTTFKHYMNIWACVCVKLIVFTFIEEFMPQNEMTAMDKIMRANEYQGKNSLNVLEGDIAVSNKRGSRSCFARSCLWPKSVDGNVYIAYTLSPEYRMEAIENGTCIRFVPQTHQNDYLDIQPKSGCWSYLGFHGGPQIVSLQAPECVTTGVTSHELMHALGFVHEQSRADRDKYVTILWEHVQKFEKYKTNNLDTPYDYASIMHFGKYAYSEDGDPTIIAKGNLGAQLGQRFAPSELDKFKINKLYKCGECCSNMQ
uniref:Metalloendopeptidase n=1 Tax=Paramormyrops kingsleyae TaxID=1676925 RepID=A0A3B3SCZ7_9TELE